MKGVVVWYAVFNVCQTGYSGRKTNPETIWIEEYTSDHSVIRIGTFVLDTRVS